MFPSLLGFPRGSGEEAAAPTLLPDGIYWQSGDASAKLPLTGQGWLLTTNLNDGSSGDTTTRETGASASITVLHVHAASPFTIGTWNITLRWKGDLVDPTKLFEGDGATWTELAFASGMPLAHGAYTDEQWSAALFTSPTSKGYHLAVATESDTSGGFMSCSDSRPAA